MSEKTVSRSRLCVVGLGYIGLPTAIFFANSLKDVVGADTDKHRISSISKGELPFSEPGLDELLKDCIGNGSLTVRDSVVRAEAYIVAVPTPLGENHEIDLSFVESSIREIAPNLIGDELIVLESTCSPGTTGRVFELVAELRSDLFDAGGQTSLDVVYCPERVIPGSVLHEFKNNDRLIGGETIRAQRRAEELYRHIVDGSISLTDPKTAEVTKLVENAFRDVNIAFANELSIVADRIGANVNEVIELANRHPRVQILSPGTGVGGHCIAVDPWFLIKSAPDVTPLMKTAREVNHSKTDWVVAKIQEELDSSGSKQANLLGLTFKPDVDDTRESPALRAAVSLAAANPSVAFTVVEPMLETLPPELSQFRNIKKRELDNFFADYPVDSPTAILVAHSAFKLNIPTLNEAPGATVLDFVGIIK